MIRIGFMDIVDVNLLITKDLVKCNKNGDYSLLL